MKIISAFGLKEGIKIVSCNYMFNTLGVFNQLKSQDFEVALLDSADLYMTKDLMSYLKELAKSKIIIIFMNATWTLPKDCRNFNVIYDEDNLTVKEYFL